MAVKTPPKTTAAKSGARQPRPPLDARPSRPPKPPRANERFAHDLWGVGIVAFALLASSRAGAGASRRAAGDAAGARAAGICRGGSVAGTVSGRGDRGDADCRAGAAYPRELCRGRQHCSFLTIIAWTQLTHSPHTDPLYRHAQYGGWVGGQI